MAIPAAQPAPEPEAPRRNRRRPSRIGGALLATVAGLAVLGVGLVRSAGGLVDSSPGPSPLPSVSSEPLAGATSSPAPTTSPPSQSPPPSSAPSSSPVAERIDGPAVVVALRLQAELDRLRAKLGIPGVSATVLLPGGRSWTGVSGFADVAARVRVTPGTAFAFASVSKTFTSALIIQLAAEGRFRLTDPAAGLLPPLKVKIDRRITVGMLMNHTSGLADYFLNPKIDGPLQGRPAAAWTVDRTLRYLGKPLSPPGAAWHYSNTNYLLLGLIAERVTGQTPAEAIRSRLLAPTGLSSTWYQAAETGRAALAHGYRLPGTKVNAKPIDLSDGSGIAPFRSVVTAAGAAGSIAGTSGDLAGWARALYSGKVLGPEETATMLSGFSKTTHYLPGVSYGHGVQAFSIDGHPSLGHSGRLLGFRSVVRHFPLDGITIAVLTNQSRADPGVILRALLAAAVRPFDASCGPCALPR